MKIKSANKWEIVKDTDSSMMFFQPWEKLKNRIRQKGKRQKCTIKWSLFTYPLSPRTITLSNVLLRNAIDWLWISKDNTR